MRTRTAPWLQVGGLLALIITVFLANVGASCCVGSGCDELSPDAVKTFSKNGVSFDYPAKWTIADSASTGTGANSLWTDAVGIDNDNNMIFSAFKLGRVLTDQDFASGAVDEEARDALSEVLLDAKTDQATYAGFRASIYTGTVSENGKTTNHRFVFIYNRDIQYIFNCSWLDAQTNDMKSGCDKILATLKTQ